MRVIIAIAFLLVQSLSWADDSKIMDIGIFRDISVHKLRISYAHRGYQIFGDSILAGELYEGNVYYVSYSDRKCVLSDGTKVLGTYDTIHVRKKADEAEFKVKTISPSYRERTYQGDLQITPDNGKLRIVNQVSLYYYLAGVIESESGSRQNLEYYKVQAIISRTYALKNEHKHAKEGFMLTDLVNCQVYKNKCRYNKTIYEAVKATEGQVIIDHDLQLITASFYSNSGGQTANSEDVWNVPLPYLRSVKDPYSVGKPNYTWKKSISRKRWLDYLRNSFQYPIADSAARAQAVSFKQPYRKAFFVSPIYGIPLRDIRRDWKLKSTFFSISVSGDQVVLNGKGFGHGVGLSQEGAMVMSTKGFSYREIIHFYFTDIHIIESDLLEYYTQETTEY